MDARRRPRASGAVSGSVRLSDRTAPLRYRLRQGRRALFPRVPPDRDEILASVLSPAQADAFRALPAHDQAHLCRGYRLLVSSRDVSDHDLLVAALLHDIGKVTPTGRVSLVDRVARVVLDQMAPVFLDRLARMPAPAWRRGLALTVHHPSLGAAHAETLACSARTCWLIAHHENKPPPADGGLLRLIAADREAG